MGFAIVFNIGDTYYQQQVAGLKNDVKFRPNYMWSYLHLLLSLLMLYFAVGLKLTFNRDDSNRSFLDEKFMCGSAAGALGVIFILRLMHKGIRYKGKKVRRLSYTFRFGAAALCGIIPFWSFNSTATIAYLFLITTIIVLQVSIFVYLCSRFICHGFLPWFLRIYFHIVENKQMSMAGVQIGW